MNVLLFHPKVETLEMIRFCLESEIGLVVYAASTFQEAIDLFMDETTIDLIVCGEHPSTDKVFKYLLSTESQIPVIFLNEDSKEEIESYPDIKVIGHLRMGEMSAKLVPMIRSQFDAILSSSAGSEYCRISTSLLVRVVPLRGDIFIRLSSVKFVKLFKTGAQFTNEDLEKFLMRRKISFLYIKKSESQEFVQKFHSDLSSLVESAVPGNSELLDTVTEVHELVQDLSSRLGFNEEVRSLAKLNVKLAVKAIGSSPKLSKALSQSKLTTKNYISSHSLLIANIACSIAAQMKWPSDTTFQKLVTAALFHDFLIQDPEHAKIGTKKDLEAFKATVTPEQYNLVKTHPIQCAAVIETLTEIPADVGTIVSQHHERPDGEGFPKGLRGQQISPLSSVFIVAQDILDHITLCKGNFDLFNFLQATKPIYQNGTFLKIWKTLANQNFTSDESEDPTKSVA
jgi:HD-GYP domain-containing protein (c-di-GMP phosphodiesterase class II)